MKVTLRNQGRTLYRIRPYAPLLFLSAWLCSSFSLASPLLQGEFDRLGPGVKSLSAPASGRDIYYVDEGDADWAPVLFLGGGGTSVRVLALTEHLRSTRENLKLRFISVERNGFGTTPFDDTLGYEDYIEDVDAVLNHLRITRFRLFAISGGSPYAARLTAHYAERLDSVHLASSLSYFDDSAIECLVPAAALTVFTKQPRAWFEFAPDSPVQVIPGFQDAAFDDAARTFNMGGQNGAPDALYHELRLFCDNQHLPDLTALTSRVFLYYGEEDTTTPPAQHLNRWQQAFTNAAVTTRLYPGEGHDVQYRHLDQILVDLAGLGEYTVVCTANGQSRLAAPRFARRVLKRGGSLGICAWQD